MVCVEVDAAPDELAPWLGALASHLGGRVQVRRWAIGPRDYSGPQAAPSPHETLALYSVPPGRPPAEGDVALSVTVLPLHRRRLALELRRWSSLPAALDTVVYHLAAHFGQRGTTVSGAAPPRERAGAPPLACNSWLEEQLAGAPPRADLRRIYLLWLEQYRALRGFYPADPKRSFRAAVAGCRRRLRRRAALRR